MSKISFYLFESSQERQVQSTCRLCRKILRQDARIWLHCPDPAIQQELDECLWTFDPSSFMSHGIDQTDAMICISAQLPDAADWIIFNFSAQALDQCQQFSHIIEIIENHENAKKVGREKYKYYRRLGIEPQTFKL